MNFRTIASSAAIGIALFAATPGIAAQETSCTSKLAKLSATQKTFEAQLASIPQNLTIDGEKKPNRLYEQIMLENISALAEISQLRQECAQNASTFQTSKPQQINHLRAEIAALKNLVADLALENKKLSGLIEQLSRNSALMPTISPCDDRKQILMRKLDSLHSLGYDASHPDVVNISRQLETIAADCAADPPFMTAEEACVSRAADIEKKLDQLKSLGYKDGHPDIKNIKRQLETVGDECSVSSSKG